MNVILTKRPSALPAAWAPVSAASACGDQSAIDRLVGDVAVRNLLAVGAPQLPQAHQLSRKAVLGQARAQRVRMAASYGTKWTTAFRGDGITTAKQAVGGVSGAPPRGRPV